MCSPAPTLLFKCGTAASIVKQSHTAVGQTRIPRLRPPRHGDSRRRFENPEVSPVTHRGCCISVTEGMIHIHSTMNDEMIGHTTRPVR